MSIVNKMSIQNIFDRKMSMCVKKSITHIEGEAIPGMYRLQYLQVVGISSVFALASIVLYR
jgi:hypothetical protein